MPELSNRTADFTDSVIRRMTRISNQYGAVNLSQGFPDFEPPREILDRLAQVTNEDFHQYSITWGAQNFREALAVKYEHFTGRAINPNGEIVVTCGSTEAMMAAMMSVTNPGDKVIVFSPFYENYGADTILSGAEPIYVPLVPPEFNFDVDVLEAAFKQHPKALILCNPSNPCGKVFTREELQIIADLAEKYDTFVITDEVYEHILYTPNKHTYFATLPRMWERTIQCSSLSKTYSITGWRLGYVIAPPNVIDTVKKVHDFLTVGAAAPLQEAAVTGLKFGDDYYKWLQDKYTEKRDLFLRGLDDIGINHTVPQGAYEDYVFLAPPSSAPSGLMSAQRMFAVLNSGSCTEGGWDLVNYLLSDDLLTSYLQTESSFVTTKSAFEKILDHERYISENPVEILPDGQQLHHLTYLTDDERPAPLSDEEIAKYRQLISSADSLSGSYEQVKSIAEEEFAEFAVGETDAATCAERIQNRVTIYLSENS